MENEVKLVISVLIVVFGIWLLLPELPSVKPGSAFGLDLVLWPYLLDLIKGIIPIAAFLFGSLILWIEYDEFRTQRSMESGEEEDEMPEFEDVEYKDLECPECGEDFKTDIGLKVHRKVNHPDSYEGD